MEKEQVEGQFANSPAESNIGDVMVVGGGISGIQASLDLADTGFKVYLVDKSPVIGGKMSQLDKTFTTNDCSMCIESPKFIECSRHPNIDILTYTEVDRVEGEAGNFKVTQLKSPDTLGMIDAGVVLPVLSTARSRSSIDIIKTYPIINAAIYTFLKQFRLSLI